MPEPAPADAAEITVDALARLRREGASHVVLDVREVPELAICALEGALHIPMRQVPERLAEIPRDRPVVVLCHHGIRSWQVTQYLRREGVERAVNLAGGIDAWAIEIDPAMARY